MTYKYNPDSKDFHKIKIKKIVIIKKRKLNFKFLKDNKLSICYLIEQ
jgi:hypothetical protein